jgi:hypothetical protein
MQFRRLAVQNNKIAIVYSEDYPMPSTHFGVISLAEDSFQAVDLVKIPFSIRYKSGRQIPLNEYLRNGPVIIMNGADFFLGFLQSGIVRISKDGRMEHFNEENGLASNEVRALEYLDGKLYALIGAQLEESGLMEVDPKNGASAVLYSTKSKEMKGAIDGKRITGIAADGERHALWIVTSEVGGSSLYLYYPAERKLEKFNHPDLTRASRPLGICQRDFNSCLRKSEDRLIFDDNFYNLSILDLNGKKAEKLISNLPSDGARWPKFFDDWERMPGHYIPLGEDLIAINSAELMYFHSGEKDPEFLESFLPGSASSRQIRDIALTPKGLFVLTSNALYLIPEIIKK